LSRQGFEVERGVEVIEQVTKHETLELSGIMTHYASSDEPGNKFTKTQIDRFARAISEFDFVNNLDVEIHIANSGAAILKEYSIFNTVRIGIANYGLWPSDEVIERIDLDLNPVLKWKTKIIQLKYIQVGDIVGYGETFKATQRMKIAILPVGYSDGYDRGLSNNSYVTIRNTKCKLLGRVMMNHIVVDVTEIKDIQEGDEVQLLGEGGMSATEMAKRIGTINYEIVTRINWATQKVVV